MHKYHIFDKVKMFDHIDWVCFYLGLIEMGHENIIRVGGRSSEEMDHYNLRNRTEASSDPGTK